jgi:hypothetical protein
MNKWIKYTCKFCDTELEEFKFLPSECKCDEYQKAKEKWVKRSKEEIAKQSQKEQEEYDKKYPIVFQEDRLILEKNTYHKLVLEARQYKKEVGLTVRIPFAYEDKDGKIKEDGGLAWDLSLLDGRALHDLLGEYLDAIDEEH